jgi:hypothetical protein
MYMNVRTVVIKSVEPGVASATDGRVSLSFVYYVCMYTHANVFFDTELFFYICNGS